jgi:predicted nucleotidyltransferase
MEYLQLFKKLSQQQVRYLICGGLAVNIYGIPRMTANIDLLLDFTDENIDKFENVIKLLMYQSTIPVSIKTFVNIKEQQKVINDKNLIAYSYFNSQRNYMNLDVLIDVPIPFNELWNMKEKRFVDGTSVNIVSVEHLIVMKQYANRKQDIDDVILLSKLLKNE